MTPPNPYPFLRPLIYRLTPEQAHAFTLALLRLGGATPPGRWLLRQWFKPAHPGPVVRAFGLEFANPIGLAAGYDKDGLGWRGLACLGFGHLELGTVTPRPQPGNPRPRVFRLVEDQAVINRMGFPGRGAAFMARRLQGAHFAPPSPLACPQGQGGPRPAGLVLGVNIGKNKDTPLEQAAADYVSLFQTLAPLADYLAVNVSSPNTPGLRSLQSRQALEELLAPLAAARAQLAHAAGRRVPLLVKLAPDLDDAGLDGALQAILACGMDGVIQGNTTLSRPPLAPPSPLAFPTLRAPAGEQGEPPLVPPLGGLPLSSSHAGEAGGLSGLPLEPLALAALRRTVARLEGRLPVIASGGVLDPAAARARLDAGAALVQLYTGLIYRGPWLVREIVDSLP